MEPSNLQRLFCACDVNQSGKIEFEDFTLVCRELNVPDAEVQTLFGKFDVDDDGCIDYGGFSSRFQEVFQARGLAAAPGMEFAARFDAECVLSESLREQLADLHQTLQACANTIALQQYERVIFSVVSQSLDNRLECDQLEASLRRVEDMNSSQLSELEDDMQKQLAGTEERARTEEHKKMEEVLWNMQRKHENQIADLQATVDRLLQSQAASQFARSKEEELSFNQRVGNLSQENELLRSSLLESQTNVGVLHTELDKLKNMYADERAQHERETNELKRMVIEYESYASQIQILQDLNKQLYDSNDSLRSAWASEEAKRELPQKNEVPARRMKPMRQSTLKRSSLESSNSTMSIVSLWADRYLDSGVSLPLDTTESSTSDMDMDTDMDTDDGRGSTETVHRSYSCAHSDGELLDVKSEAGMSLAQSFGSSTASSMRKQLSAFAKEVDAVPMYSLVLAGDAGTGKSSFLLRLALNQFKADIQTTLGVDFQIKKMLVDGQKTNLKIWDTAGQERFRSIARFYFRKAHGVLLLYDVTSESSYLNIREWLDQIQNATEDKVPVCIIGNKVDMREQTPAKRCVSTLHGEKLATTYGALFCETSAKEGTNVVEAVLHLAREVKKNVKVVKPKTSPVELSATNAKKTLGTCCRL
ncbi:ras and EF-hand domain-containing protein [Phycodurus eques]|uniref:ras and EF-hand domain-containing protein n=1 Tax=Phycodurus eques TaxID=693459 RepID=UPI002ACE1222|nr:ras and EF-hand domain-containing protein [Phycodurus eques]